MELKTCLNDAFVKINHEMLLIQRDEGFLSVGTSLNGGGTKFVKSIVNLSLNTTDKFPLILNEEKTIDYDLFKDLLKENHISEPAAIMVDNSEMENIINITIDDATVIISHNNKNELSVNLILIFDEKLDEGTLLELFKAAIEAKSAALWDLGVINHFSFDPLASVKDDSILVACTGPGDLKSHDEVSGLYKLVEQVVRKAVGEFLRKNGYPKDVLGFMKDVGVKVEDLVDAGMELCVGVEKTEELNIKLYNQILKSLEDLNVVSLIIAGIRLEEDYEKHRVRGLNVDEDPAYLYTDEVLGIAVANQIAGTKAMFNFKRYDEAKPGIIATLGPALDDIFAGLVAGCMSKIFEE